MNKIKAKNILKELVIVSGYAVLAVMFTYPLVTKISTHVIGNDHSDVWQRIWNSWWFEKCLLNFKNLFYTDYLYYPGGTNLVFHDMDIFNLSISFLLQRVFSFTVAYNLLILFSLLISAYSAYLLVKYLTNCRTCSFISGVIFAFCPYIRAQMYNGITGLVWSGWIPLHALYLFKAVKEEKKDKNIFLSFLFLFFISINSQYYFIYAVVFTCIFLIYYYKKTINKNFLPPFVGFALLFIILSMVVFYPKMHFYIHGWAPSTPLKGMAVNTDLQSLLLPFKANSASIMPFYYHIDYIGCTIIALVLCSLAVFFKNRDLKFWFFILIVSIILAAGPSLIIGNKEIAPNFAYIFLYKYCPLFSIMRFPYRFVIITMLAAAVLSAYALMFIFSNAGGMVRKITLIFISAIIVAEFIFISLPPWPMPLVDTSVPLFYYDIARMDGDFAIIEVPIYGHKCLYYQIIHGKKIIGGYISRPRPSINLFIQSIGPLNLSKSNLEDWKMPSDGLDLDEKKLIFYNIKYIILHRSLIPKEHFIDLNRILSMSFKDKITTEDLVVYKVF